MASAAAIRRRAYAELLQVMDPDDQVVAGTWALTGPPVWLDLLYSARLVAFVPLVSPIATAGLLVPLVGLPRYLAVTGRQLICVRMSRRGGVEFSVPVSDVRVTGTRRGTVLDSIRYTGPGESGTGFSTTRQWRADFDATIAALRAGGAAVEPPVDSRREPPSERKRMIQWMTGR